MGNDFVRAGYDRIAETYVAQRDQFKNQRFLERFAMLLPPGGRVLDVGCGGGVPADAFLIERGFAVHGIDLSPRMIELAKANVPQATYAIADMSDLRPDQERVDGIVSLYAIFHTPRAGHAALLRTLASFLPAGGALLITMGVTEWEGIEDFHGTEMSWSHFGAEENLRLVERAGFVVQVNEIDPTGGEQHQVIIARRMERQPVPDPLVS